MTKNNVLKLAHARKEKWVTQMEREWAEVGAEIRKMRERLGLTISNVAFMVGVSPSTISRFERGKSVMSARLLENAIKLYFESKEVDDDYDKAAGYSIDIINGEVCLVCNEVGHIHLRVKPILPLFMQRALDETITAATAMGYIDEEYEVLLTDKAKNIYYLPNTESLTKVKAVTLRGSAHLLYRAYGDVPEGFETYTSDEIREYTDQLLEKEGAFITDKAFVNGPLLGKIHITYWKDGSGEVVPALSDYISLVF